MQQQPPWDPGLGAGARVQMCCYVLKASYNGLRVRAPCTTANHCGNLGVGAGTCVQSEAAMRLEH
eukprot:1133519-Pelagomonas_calceolata.AAC.11